MLKKIYRQSHLAALFMFALLVSNAYASNRFEALKDVVFKQAYDQRPTYKVDRKRFGKSGANAQNHLRVAAKRTLEDSRDLLEFGQGQKLLQANGICFVGLWQIDQTSQFTGLFARGANSPAIVRASVALGGVMQKDKRAFGLAIKLLPDDLADQPSLNIFALNSMGGVITKHVLDLSVDNQPPLGRVPNWRDIRTALRMRKDLQAADKTHLKNNKVGKSIKPNVAYRPVKHVAVYGSEAVIAPQWIRFSALTAQRIDQNDFRDELELSHYPNNELVYQIEVAEYHKKGKEAASWQTIGRLTLHQSIVSKACDTQLHFQHPGLGS